MTDKIIGNEFFWLAAMAPPLLFFLCLLGNRAWQMLKSIHHRLANRKPSRFALALGATIPLAFAAFIALQLLWAATDDNRVARCEREHQARLAKCKETKKDAHDSADMEFELAKDKCANKREEDLAQCESAYNEAIENCAFTRDDKKRKADNQLKADLLKCNGDPDCILNAILARALAHANADSDMTNA